MTKNWWFKFDFKVWRTDASLRRCSLEARAFWLECLCAMYEANGYELRGSPEELGRLLGCFPEEVTRNAAELKRTGAADVEIKDGEILLLSRRLRREELERDQARKRQAKFRENGGGDPERWTAIRAIILTRDGKRCAYCAKYATTVDHIIPRSKGGTHDESNLVAACKKCNFHKGDRTPEDAGMSFHATFNHQQLASNTQVTRKSQDRVISKSKSKKENTPNGVSKKAPQASDFGEPRSSKKFSSLNADALVAATENALGFALDNHTAEHLTETVPKHYADEWLAVVKDRICNHGSHDPNFIRTRIGYWFSDFRAWMRKNPKEIPEEPKHRNPTAREIIAQDRELERQLAEEYLQSIAQVQ